MNCCIPQQFFYALSPVKVQSPFIKMPLPAVHLTGNSPLLLLFLMLVL